MKKVLTVVLLGLASGLVACAGDIGKSQGDPCGGSQDECGSNLTCQPIVHSDGSKGDYCCPTPAWTSTKSVCIPASH